MTTINTNIGAIPAKANMDRVNEDMNAVMRRLSSAHRINALGGDGRGLCQGIVRDGPGKDSPAGGHRDAGTGQQVLGKRAQPAPLTPKFRRYLKNPGGIVGVFHCLTEAWSKACARRDVDTGFV